MHVQGDGGNGKGGVLRLSRPDELGIEMGIVGVAAAALLPVGLGRDQAHGRVVEPLLVFVLVGFDGLFVRLMGAGHFGSSLPLFTGYDMADEKHFGRILVRTELIKRKPDGTSMAGPGMKCL